MIVNDYDSLINARLNLIKDSKVLVKMMDFDNTDFDAEVFDLVYAQASISLLNRNKIVKEIKRILKPEATLCVGEITALDRDFPPFVRNIFDHNHRDATQYVKRLSFLISPFYYLITHLRNQQRS